MRKKLNILIADDEESIGYSLAGILEIEGYNVAVTVDGCEAVELAKRNDFDLAFFDIRMPKMNGVEALEEIRKFNNKIVVVMMTAYAENVLIEEAIKIGVLECIGKPFEISKVLDIALRVEAGAVARKKSVVIVSADTFGFLDLKTDMVRKGYKVESFLDVISLFGNFSKVPLDFIIFEPKSMDELKCLELKLKEQDLKTKIIVFVDYENASLIEEFKQNGVLFMRKPFSKIELLESMRD
ncbi:MAG: response regulator [Endomicrobium sp.]|jgi:DNA-binding NtrC family response regulator|nr:response regulator [Endomicrobium sp.]